MSDAGHIASGLPTTATGLPPAGVRDILNLARVPSDRPVFCMEDGTIHWQGREIELAVREAQILGALYKRQPRWTTVPDLADMIWPGMLPADPGKSLHTPICRLRQKLDGVPLEIRSRKQYGYKLVGELTVE